ncbi:hypothetical protein E0X81_07990 [Halomonas sp. GDM18]|nr:hypothetical protein E0X81_07990 [Halomonas sp. GDM18]
MYAYIKSIGNKEIDNYSKERLTIDGKNIAFFLPTIHDFSEFYLINSTAKKEWLITFFKKTPLQTSFKITFCDDIQEDHRNILATAGYFSLSNTASLDSQKNKISFFLRNSNALTIEDVRPTSSGRYIVNDRKGLAYCSNDASQFERIVLCQALATAYHRILTNCITKLTEKLKAHDYVTVNKLYEIILFFNATDFYTYPVLVNRHELFEAWNQIREHWHIYELNQELTSQLKDVALILHSRAEKEKNNARHLELKNRQENEIKIQQRWRAEDLRIKESENIERERVAIEKSNKERLEKEKNEREKMNNLLIKERESSRNQLLTLVGIGLTFISLLNLVELKPNDFKEAYIAWHGVVWPF